MLNKLNPQSRLTQAIPKRAPLVDLTEECTPSLESSAINPNFKISNLFL